MDCFIIKIGKNKRSTVLQTYSVHQKVKKYFEDGYIKHYLILERLIF